MRQLAIFIITVFIFSITNFTTANAQTFGPDDDGFFGGFDGGWDAAQAIEGMTWEEWRDFCGDSWECNWAWEDPEVMEQLLESIASGYDTFLIIDEAEREFICNINTNVIGAGSGVACSIGALAAGAPTAGVGAVVVILVCSAAGVASSEWAEYGQEQAGCNDD